MIIAQEARQGEDFERPSTICEKHWQEWIDSAVHPSIIVKNISSIYDSRELDEILNRNNKKRYKHFEIYYISA